MSLVFEIEKNKLDTQNRNIKKNLSRLIIFRRIFISYRPLVSSGMENRYCSWFLRSCRFSCLFIYLLLSLKFSLTHLIFSQVLPLSHACRNFLFYIFCIFFWRCSKKSSSRSQPWPNVSERRRTKKAQKWTPQSHQSNNVFW